MLAARFARAATPRVFGSRTYAAATQHVKVPVQLFGVDGTYASALVFPPPPTISIILYRPLLLQTLTNLPCTLRQYTASVRDKTIDAVDNNLKSLKSLLQKETKLASILASPTLRPEEKSALVAELQKVIGQDKAIGNLLGIMAENNRLGLINGVIDQFGTLMKAHRGEVEAIVTSAQVWTLQRWDSRWEEKLGEG